MNYLVEMEKKILPELVEVVEKRYNILYSIFYNQPVGRRMLSSITSMTERVIRDEVDVLRTQRLISTSATGMRVTKEGEEVLESLRDFIHDLKGLPELEKFLQNKLGIGNIVIVPGDVDKNRLLLDEMGKRASSILSGLLHDNLILAVAGGSTIAAMSKVFAVDKQYNNLTVVPARGGLGREVEFQANTITAVLSKKLNANYQFLNIPDDISTISLNALLKEKGIKKVIDLVKSADILIYGIGRADIMAARRHLDKGTMEHLENIGAVAETMGYYLNIDGEIVYTTGTISLNMDELKDMRHKLAISGGTSKGEAILSSCRAVHPENLVIDEGAALKMIKLIKSL